MTLLIPGYIQRANPAAAPIAYGWDDADPEFAYLAADERMEHRVAKTSFRGVMALAAGFAEWVAWRHADACHDLLLVHQIEAVWAAIVDFRYLAASKLPPQHDWHGPIRGSLWQAADLLRAVIRLTRSGQFAFPETVNVSQLALYVLPDPKPFKDWRRFVITRLAQLYPANLSAPLGVPVPREALDPDLKFDPAHADAFIDTFLRGLDPQKNPFLAAPADMVAAGFSGTPYTYP